MSRRATPLLAATLIGCTFDPASGPGDDGPCATAFATCVSDTVLRTCAAGAAPVDTECSWGCSSSEIARCNSLVPAGGALTAMDFDPAGLADLVLSTETTFDTNSGEISGVRPMGAGTASGIDFERRGEVAVFRVKSLRVASPVRLTGDRAFAIVAQDAIVIEALVDGRGDPLCGADGRVAGPGGSDGGAGKMAAPGSGGGAGTDTDRHGGGGGGHGGAGGSGGGGAAGGASFGAPEIAVLAGGGGGGGGAGGANAGTGGGGGAAIQLASNTSISITASGGINAGGCGGDKGTGGNDGGGGGGAGGTILLEAPIITIEGALGVNGGGGGTHNAAGAHATLDRVPAPGGIAPNAPDGDGGAGGAAGIPAANASQSGTFGAGGGAVGWMRFNTSTGSVVIQPGAVLSPALDDADTTTTQARAATAPAAPR